MTVQAKQSSKTRPRSEKSTRPTKDISLTPHTRDNPLEISTVSMPILYPILSDQPQQTWYN